MKILPTVLLTLCLLCAFSPSDAETTTGEPVRFTIPLTQPQITKGNTGEASLDQSTPFNTARLLLRALQDQADWTKPEYSSLSATSPFVGPLKLRSILARIESVQSYVNAAPPDRPPFVDESSIAIQGNLAIAYMLLPDKVNPYVYAATAIALVKKGDQWKASLTPGSFDNTFLPFDGAMREQAATMTKASKQKIFDLARQYSVASVKTALEHIKRFRKESIQGTSDDELKAMLIQIVKESDPARIAALLVNPYYMESAISQSARLTPVVKSMRLQDRNTEEERYVQPTYLSFMSYPSVILIPLQPGPGDVLPPKENEGREEKKDEKKEPKDIHSIVAMTIAPPRMSMPDMEGPALIYRYALEKVKDPTDGGTAFKMPMSDAFRSWEIKEDEPTMKRILTDFHRTYPAQAFANPQDAITAACKALETKDSLTLIRMLAPDHFSSVKKFTEALSFIKTPLTTHSDQLERIRRNLREIQKKATKDNTKEEKAISVAYVTKDQDTAIQATMRIPGVAQESVIYNLYFIKTDQGWMLNGIDDKNIIN